ncbi:MAG: 3-hydroxyacyl-ACP dehydratase FabZ [Alphaproteobacteria bacterium]|nr:3-hydroxyacyl-ACP dehydratase FabZ [Alphaproteobacteria bacterium]MBV9420000.1 3-hydroxyacyl-ACP dehydratase FabZ [Alphaproteobacteria bacterium]MBV9540232.1 3-hydroxyacyl-ACP dehydratase FabZ [Alphaproteobacteria bacterium]MBV9905880.1 3-hydroxyacyl-ACP dehydratase FabZ [Alphaproteobacteria bacterium]
MGETATAQTGLVLDIEQLKKLIPHRWPFIFIERLHDIVPYKSAIGHKTVGINEPHFLGHFPNFSVMPGVLIIEALAQTAGALIIYSMGLDDSPGVFFMGIDKARFRKPVVPGDVLKLHVKAIQNRGPVWKFEGKAYVDGTLCCEGDFSAMIRKNEPV